jgi:EKC/KEOPS complex subunit PCC1/LAGE3
VKGGHLNDLSHHFQSLKEYYIIPKTVPCANFMATTNLPFSATINLPFPSLKRAEAALGSLSVDKELSPDSISRTFKVNQETKDLEVTFYAVNTRYLRIALSSFFDMAKVVIETIEEFDI